MLVLLLLACSNDASDVKSEPTPEEPASILGPADRAAADAVWLPILTAEDRLTDPRDLGFDVEGNLWVANREDDRTFIVFDPGSAAQIHERRKDGYAMHFMEETSAISFEGESGAGPYGPEFGTCGESRNTYDDQYRPNDFMGPVLWTADLDIFAKEDPYGLGSHLDMLHESPLCVGIAWEKDNVYWVFDGKYGTIVRYDFQEDHDIGQDDHSDGLIYRLTEPLVSRVEDAPGHMAFDPVTGMLYVADTGNGRILRIDTATGQRGSDLPVSEEPVEDYATWEGVVWEEVVTGLDRPGGLALHDGHLIVGEWGTGVLYDFTLDGELVASLDTEVGPEALYGVEVGPDGALWVTETASPAVLRLEP
jgi:sugar lactone lactonase YvrE